MERVILHCDINNFYASVECLYNLNIRESPVAVCGDQELRAGIVLAKNNYAKKMGVKTAEPIWSAKQKCPNLIIVKPNYNRYVRFSKLAKSIYKDYTDNIESFGIDECWLDVTDSIGKFGNGEKIAYLIKERIKHELGITVSIGVSFNKIFAKLGSDYKKPDAVTVITQENYKEIVWSLPVDDLLYVGQSMKQKLNMIGIYKIGELAQFPLEFIENRFGKCGQTIWNYANGRDNCKVNRIDYQLEVKGIGNSMTTSKDLISNEEVKIVFYVLAESVAKRLRMENLKGRTIRISIKDNDLNYIERQSKFSIETFTSFDIAKKANRLFRDNWKWDKNIRSLGIRIIDLKNADDNIQYSFFKSDIKVEKKENIERCVDNIRYRFGDSSIKRAVMINNSVLNLNTTEETTILPAFTRGEI